MQAFLQKQSTFALKMALSRRRFEPDMVFANKFSPILRQNAR